MNTSSTFAGLSDVTITECGVFGGMRTKQLLAAFPGVIVQDDPAAMEYPMPLFTSNRNEVFVGRIRQDDSVKYGLNLWVVGDQIRKGAALNALQIAELMIAQNLL